MAQGRTCVFACLLFVKFNQISPLLNILYTILRYPVHIVGIMEPIMSEREFTSIDWKIVCATTNEMEAEVIAGRLESEGITARTHQEPAGRAFGFTVGLLGEVAVLVDSRHYWRAREILDTPMQEEG